MLPFRELLFDYPLLSLAQLALTIWMLVDCQRRSADYFWFWVILLLQPIGAWVYFFVYKVKDFSHLQGLSERFSFVGRPALEELRYQAEQTPTLATHLTLGERLMECGEHAEAIRHLEAARAREADHCQVLYALAVCQSELGCPQEAVPLLEKVVARERAWSDYRAWRLLITVRAQSGDGAGALAAGRELARLSPTLQHRCLLAECLLKEGRTDEAQQLLEQALESHRFAPSPIRRRDARWARVARSLQKRG